MEDTMGVVWVGLEEFEGYRRNRVECMLNQQRFGTTGQRHLLAGSRKKAYVTRGEDK
jgi:hypothetical protein